MCDPISIAAAAATVGGGLLQSSAANSAAKEQAQMMANERNRQALMERDKSALFDDTLRRSGRDTMDEEMSNAEKERNDLYTALIEDAPTADTIGSEFNNVTSNKVVQDEIDRRGGMARERSLDMAGLRAVLDSFGDANFNQSIMRGRNADKISMLQGFGRGSAAVLPAEMAAAAQKGQGKAMLGQILSTAGQVGSFAGGAGWNPFKSGNVSPGINLNDVFSSGVAGAPAGPGVQFGAGNPGIRLPIY